LGALSDCIFCRYCSHFFFLFLYSFVQFPHS
jgi:hypothetical protein